jgi:NAD(P)-dependent dehydrogenase (short-subunit alcohol dehydrogenase family)
MGNHFSLQDKNIVISGGTSGIGEMCCQLISDYGGVPIVIGRSSQKLDLLQKRISPMITVYVDLQNFDALEDTLSEKIKGLKIHGFIHSAGIELTRPFRNLAPEEVADAFKINFLSGMVVAKMLSRKIYLSEAGSSFIFISSVMSVAGEPGKTGYAATKGAVTAFAKSLALELATKSIRVNSISPGAIETPMSKPIFDSIGPEKVSQIVASHPLGLGKPEDVGLACVYLLSDAARWITGTNLIIDGGFTAS